MRFFQQCQVKVRDQKPLSCTKTNKTYFSKLPSTYFFIGSQMEGFRGSSTHVFGVVRRACKMCRKSSFGPKPGLANLDGYPILFWQKILEHKYQQLIYLRML